MSAAADSLRQDVKVIGLVALAHGLSHFFQIATAVLFPLIKDDLGVSYAALGATVALYYVVSAICQTLAGFAVDRYGARRVLFAGLALAGARRAARGLRAELRHAGGRRGGRRPRQQRVPSRAISRSSTRACDKERLGYAFSGHGIAGYLGYAAAPVYGIAMARAVRLARRAARRGGDRRRGGRAARVARRDLAGEPAARARHEGAGLGADLRVLASGAGADVLRLLHADVGGVHRHADLRRRGDDGALRRERGARLRAR